MKLFLQVSDGMYFLWPLIIISAAHILITWVFAFRRGKEARSSRQECRLLNPTSYPLISVIIPAWNDFPALERCLVSLRQVDYPHWEAIVVAGGTDATYESTKKLCQGDTNIRVIEQCSNGKNAALNQGLTNSKAEFVVLLDADSIFEPDLFSQLITPLVAGKADASTGKITPIVRSPVSMSIAMEAISSQEIANITILQGASSIALKREVIEEIGGFPEEVKVGVDWDLDNRLAKKKKVFCPRAIVATELPAGFKEFYANEIRWRRAHFASIFRFSLPSLSLAFSLYIYVLSWFYIIVTIQAVLAIIFLDPILANYAVASWLILSAWIFLRRIALPIEVCSYTADKDWLKIGWVPPVLLLETFLAIIVATLTPGRNDPHFKGPRSLVR